jgi:L-ascorbate metabolism protein UlaG (beta-lactamase superfamily)
MAIKDKFETDLIPTTSGDLAITFLGHASLLMGYKGKNIYIDPYGEVADYSTLPKADLVLVTHDHYDHMDLKSLGRIRTDKTLLVVTEISSRQVEGGIVLHNGDVETVMDIPIAAIPAYNILHKRSDGNPFHPKGAGNGYIMTFGKTRLYIAGDTENIPEMTTLRNIDVAFLPMNLPYTMTPEMVADAARAFKPKIIYPYHFGETDVTRLKQLLKDEKDIEIRIRLMN